MRRNAAYMKVLDYHVFCPDDHDFRDGRPGDNHEILLKLWPWAQCSHNYQFIKGYIVIWKTKTAYNVKSDTSLTDSFQIISNQ